MVAKNILEKRENSIKDKGTKHGKATHTHTHTHASSILKEDADIYCD
jgi:hypothetical protein